MQNIPLLHREVLELSAKLTDCSVRVLQSHSDQYNRVAAIHVYPFPLPKNVVGEPQVGLIPIPDFYGFATSCTVVAFDKEIRERSGRPIPFCEQVEQSTIAQRSDMYVCARESPDVLIERWTVCAWVEHGTDRFSHTSLSEFVSTIIGYLEKPYEVLETEVSRLVTRAKSGNADPLNFLQLAHLAAGLGDVTNQERVLRRASTLFPGDKWIEIALQGLNKGHE